MKFVGGKVEKVISALAFAFIIMGRRTKKRNLGNGNRSSRKSSKGKGYALYEVVFSFLVVKIQILSFTVEKNWRKSLIQQVSLCVLKSMLCFVLNSEIKLSVWFWTYQCKLS